MGHANGHNAIRFKVYVNPVGKKAMLSTMKYPVGSIIVKEKLEGKGSDLKVELLTVMRKHEAGFSPDTGDWEFLVTDRAGESIAAPESLVNCMGCHQDRKNSDYVFATYLPHKTRDY
jgi:hypothetical protein